MSKNFVSNEDASSLFGKVGERLGLRPKTFTGTHDQWDLLTELQQSEYEYVNFTDDYTPGNTLDRLPRLFISADHLPTTKDDVSCEFEYSNGEYTVKAYGKIKCQGTSSMSYAKKNFTIKLFEDAERTIPLNREFKSGWGSHNTYCLKANWVDHSHMRNIISGNLWREIVESRSDYDDLPSEMKSAYNHGAVDGFPFKLYANGKYEGIYTWNIPKADWMFGMSQADTTNVALCAESNSHSPSVATACNFKKLWTGVDGSDWSIEVGTNSAELVTAVNTAIGFVMNSTDSEFISGINDHFDLTNIIDYYIFAYFINALDNLGKNMIMLSYDQEKWYLSPYDLDSTYGNFYDGSYIVSPEYKCPQDYEEAYNRLFERLWDCFPLEIKARYSEIREQVLNSVNIIKMSERFYSTVGKDMYDEDVAIYPGIPNKNGNNVWQIEKYISERKGYVDAIFDSLSERVPCTGIDVWNLGTHVGSTGTLTVDLTPANATDRVFYVSNDPSIISVDDFGNYMGNSVGETTITVTCNGHTDVCTVQVTQSQTQYTISTVPVTNTVDHWWQSSLDPNEYVPLNSTGCAICIRDLSNIPEVDVVMYDENKDLIRSDAIFNYNGQVYITEPDCQYIRITFNDSINQDTHETVEILTGGVELTASDATWIAGTLNTETGEVTPDAESFDWYSQYILRGSGRLHTMAAKCMQNEASYNHKGFAMYDSEYTYLGLVGSNDATRGDYEEDVTVVNAVLVKLTAHDMDVDSKTPLNKVRIFNFNKNHGKGYSVQNVTFNTTSDNWWGTDDLLPLKYEGAEIRLLDLTMFGEIDIRMYDSNGDLIRMATQWGNYNGAVILTDPGTAYVSVWTHDVEDVPHESIRLLSGNLDEYH